MRPLCIDLFCGLGGWAEGFLAERYDVIGFDIERRPYPGQLVLQDVLTLHGSQFKDAACIVASPPCQEYSYMAMPWSRAKQIMRALRVHDDFPLEYEGSRSIDELTALFDACFRIQREASEAAGHYIPMVVENVKGAQPWVGRAKWHYGSFYLWGDVPALMPHTFKGQKNTGGSWFAINRSGQPGQRNNPRDDAGVKQGGTWWHDPESMTRKYSSKSNARKAASAQIAKIPFQLAQYIAQVYKLQVEAIA